MNQLKERLKKEGSQSVTNCNRLKFHPTAVPRIRDYRMPWQQRTGDDQLQNRKCARNLDAVARFCEKPNNERRFSPIGLEMPDVRLPD